MFLKTYSASFSYALTTAFSAILIHLATQKHLPLPIISLCALIAIIWFNVGNRKRLRTLYTYSFHHLKHIIILNVIIAIQWIGTFYGIKIIMPYQFLIVLFLVPVMLSNITLLKYGFTQWLFLLVNIGTIATLFILIKNSLGFYIAIVVGILSYCYRKYSHFLMKDGHLSAMDILSVRNYALLLVSFTLYVIYHTQYPVSLPPLWSLLLIPFVSFIIPIYLNQIGIRNANAERHSMIASLTPLFTMSISIPLGIQQFNWIALLIILLIGVSLIVQNIMLLRLEISK